MKNGLICLEGIASANSFMVATLESKLPCMYIIVYTKNEIFCIIMHTTVSALKKSFLNVNNFFELQEVPTYFGKNLNTFIIAFSPLMFEIRKKPLNKIRKS